MAEIKTIAVIGAGIMGRGIAHVAALGGYRTILEDLLPVLEAEKAGDLRGRKEQLPQPFRTEVSVNTAGNYDSAFTAAAKKPMAAFKKQLVEIDVFPLPPSVDDRHLILVLGGRAEVCSLMIVCAEVRKPSLSKL